ncbi:bifunctional 2-polyprenyl-6-hydroxyphenol methylase/3-demethylubiquinol 3-O-methyltransferase UbiG [Tenacibaculum sp. SG-28]|uniref:class I SAM-dependent methyltransferase n=1 Tax=Tenacibaculum sp. SG-28 TaxID=754426 RepID=UPI000CF5193C|nr:class I SAM-dependent methyltransferase [Tenacibaculum sp. SG-28]PQJ23000.1 SAM-dependent methyltransferase [Tenacibaculum sp. SG-28]
MENYKHYFDTNKTTWNKRISVHLKSPFYNVEAFKSGQTSLNSYELDALGDVTGKKLLHLQCHFGQDTLSWSRLGANCTGIDLSDQAIAKAQELAEEINVSANFIACNLYDVNQYVTDLYDIVFTSYGVIGWLPNLTKWAQIIASRLKEGGVFYMVEFHPIVWMFDYLKNPPELAYGYEQKDVIYEEYSGTYADEDATIVSKEYGWNHGLGSIVTALISAGLQIEYLKEYSDSPYNVLPGLEKTETGMFAPKKSLYPLIFSIKATKP